MKEDLTKKKFREHSQNKHMPVFTSKIQIPPFPFFCPVCGRRTRNIDYSPYLTHGMCRRCLMWWVEEGEISKDKSFDEKVEKFISYIDTITGLKNNGKETE